MLSTGNVDNMMIGVKEATTEQQDENMNTINMKKINNNNNNNKNIDEGLMKGQKKKLQTNLSAESKIGGGNRPLKRMKINTTGTRFNFQQPQNLLKSTSVKEVLEQKYEVHKKPNILTLQHNMTIGEALSELAKRKVLSAPVVIESSGLEDGPTDIEDAFLGFMDLETILKELVNGLPWEHLINDNDNDAISENTLELDQTALKFFNRKIITLPTCNDGESLYRGDAHLDLFSLLFYGFFRPMNKNNLFISMNDEGMDDDTDDERMDDDEGGVEDDSQARLRALHRIAVFNERGTITNIISQSDILMFLYNEKEALGNLRFKTVEELKLTTIPAIVVDSDVPTFVAYRKMLSENVSGIAIVDPITKQLQANLSVSDLRGITPSIFSCLAFPVIEFLQREHNEEIMQLRMNKYYYSKLPKDAKFISTTSADDEKKIDKEPSVRRSARRSISRSTAGVRSSMKGPASSNLNPVICKSSTTLEQIIKLCCQHGVHRIYEVDVQNKVVGVITLSDVLHLLIH